MNKKFLLIVEGEKAEIKIFSEVLNKYGFTVKDCKKISLDDYLEIETELLATSSSEIIIAQGPKNRIRDWLLRYNKEQEDFERFFFSIVENGCAGIFIIYDVDHTLNNDLTNMFNLYKDETSGLLLVSSPCIEIMSDIDRTDPIKVKNLKSYKATRNVYCDATYHKNAIQYIIDNFEDLAIHYLEKNVRELASKNVMEHPSLVIDIINEKNERTFIDNKNIPVIYRYFTTVVYVCIAYINGLTKEIENSEIVKEYFIRKKIEKKDV